MIELGYETISGTPGTTAAITVAAVSSPVAYPRLSDVAPLGAPIHYTIEDSTGLVLETGVGISTAAGSFTRIAALTQWGGSGYTTAPSGLYSLPSSCIIYCSMSGFAAGAPYAPTCNSDANRWYEPGGLAVGTTTYSASSTGRDHWWRITNKVPFTVDAIAIHSAGTLTADICLYALNWSSGKPGKLLLGWKSASLVAGMNTLTLASRTDGAMAAAAGRIPVGPLYAMVNLASSVNIGRTIGVGEAALGGCTDSDLGGSAKCILYHDRTQGTALSDDPTITGRHGTAVSALPAIVFRGA